MDNNDMILEKLENLLPKFDIPIYRYKVNKNNLQWLKKNLGKRNKDNEYYKEASDLIDYCLDNKIYSS